MTFVSKWVRSESPQRMELDPAESTRVSSKIAQLDHFSWRQYVIQNKVSTGNILKDIWGAFSVWKWKDLSTIKRITTSIKKCIVYF